MPALLTSVSIDLKRDSAVSTILAAVAGSPIWPSTRATWLDAATSVDWVIFRELATTLKPRSTNPFTIPAPIPCDAPVTMAVFDGPLMIVYVLSLRCPRQRLARLEYNALSHSAYHLPKTRTARCKRYRQWHRRPCQP